jgi:hypothetical protein
MSLLSFKTLNSKLICFDSKHSIQNRSKLNLYVFFGKFNVLINNKIFFYFHLMYLIFI